ncbi:MAG: hypothetical protein O2867_01040 [Bacteroidetes bacterium]|nr:hypothetical protein [Bacteroidota bacterium]
MILEQYIPADYISDGQSYRAFLVDDEIAEFSTTLFAGVDYRVAVMTGTEVKSIEFRLLDRERNLLFTNRDYDMSPYWNFYSESTQDCIIEAQLDNETVQSGCAVVLITFDR